MDGRYWGLGRWIEGKVLVLQPCWTSLGELETVRGAMEPNFGTHKYVDYVQFR